MGKGSHAVKAMIYELKNDVQHWKVVERSVKAGSLKRYTLAEVREILSHLYVRINALEIEYKEGVRCRS